MIDSGASDYSSSDAEKSSSEDEAAPSSAPTPLTPDSSKASPRFPSDLKNHHCPYPSCIKAFNRPARLAEHLRSHTNTRPFVCPHTPCTKDFLRETHLKHHIKSAHTEVRDYICEWQGCGKSFLTATRLKRHLAAHEGREKHRCAVTGCGQTFRKHGTLQKHITSVHEGLKPFVCELLADEGEPCRVRFETAGKLKAHEGRVHGGNRFWCTICKGSQDERAEGNSQEINEVAFPTYAALQAHNKLAHPPTCKDCGLQCDTARELTRHIDIQHGGQELSDRQTHLCPEPDCGRGFTKKGNLTVHLRTVHAGEKPFTCGDIEPSRLTRVEGWNGENACGRCFTTKGNLEEHVRTAHLGLEHSRKAKKTNTDSANKKKKTSAIGRLTGSGYDEAGRIIPCMSPDCEFRFMREYDLDIHMQSRHHLADVDIQQLRAQRDGYGSSIAEYRSAIDPEAERDLDEQFGISCYGGGLDGYEQNGIEEAIEQAAVRGGAFWIGGGQDQDQDQEMRDDDWDKDEMEMRRLIEEEIGEENEVDVGHQMMIDPVLR